jgi:palmitoyltransferase ZDHHC4
MFVSRAWQRLSSIHRACVPVAVSLPYVCLYASVVSKSSITPENLVDEMKRYPYDKVLFHPGKQCRTCLLPKPARSKHCSICNACIARHDHHCVWLNNCVGHNNHHYFISLLLSLSVLLMYGAYLGYSLLDHILQLAFSPHGPYHWSKGHSWSSFLQFWTVVIIEDIRVGAVFLLAMMTAPLALGFFLYHFYLVWAGTTTSETARWSYWKDDIADGMVFKAKLSQIHGESGPRNSTSEPTSNWPVKSDQVLGRTDGQLPRLGSMLSTYSCDIIQPSDECVALDRKWTQVESLRDLVNIYDLGLWNNLRDIFKLPIR